MATAVIESGSVRGHLDDALADLEPGQPLPPGDDAKIGVVFVHGIGSQKPGETLLSWSRRLLRVVGTWSATRGGPYHLVRRASIDFTGSTIPYVEMELPAAGADHPAQTWVMTEAWWAAQVEPPSIGEMAGWLGARGEGLRVMRGIAGGIGESLGLPARWADFVLVRIALVLAFLVALLLYAVTRVLRLIPIASLRENVIVRSFDYFLGDWFGDIRVLLNDRAQAAAVRSRLRRAIYALRAYGCGPIVVVGHSGGTFVSYMTLVEKDETALPASRLITHGQALGLVWNLGRACDPPKPTNDDQLQQGDLLRIPLSSIRPNLRWTDFWATHDPAPAGGFERAPCVVEAPMRSRLVHNRASLRADHGAYWDNVEQFVVPVARLIETAAPGAARSRLFTDVRLADAQERRVRRVGDLSLTKMAIGSAAIAATVVVAVQALALGGATLAGIGRDLYPVLAWVAGPFAALGGLLGVPWLPAVPGDELATAIGALVAGGGFFAALRATDSAWNGWDEAAARALLGGGPWPGTVAMRLQLAACAIAGLLALVFTATGLWVALGVAVALAVLAAGWAALATRG